MQLETLAFQKQGVRRCEAHTVAVRDVDTQRVLVVVRQSGELVEVLTPDHPEFAEVVQLLSSAARISLAPPGYTQVQERQ